MNTPVRSNIRKKASLRQTTAKLGIIPSCLKYRVKRIITTILRFSRFISHNRMLVMYHKCFKCDTSLKSQFPLTFIILSVGFRRIN